MMESKQNANALALRPGAAPGHARGFEENAGGE